jgi:hypothetical protein
VTDIDRENFRGAVLKKAIGESASGGAEVDGGEIGDVKSEVMQGMLEFVAAAADELVGSVQSELIAIADGVAGFVRALAVDLDGAGKDGAFGLLAAFGESAVDESLVEASLHLKQYRMDMERHKRRAVLFGGSSWRKAFTA